MKYRTIVADPPWDVKDFGARSLSTEGFWAERHVGPSKPVPYERMSLSEIAALPVADLAEDDAHLYLWTTSAFLCAAYEVVGAWGFKVSSLLTWCKAPRGIGMGGTFVNSTEPLLFARRGSLAASRRWDTTWFAWKRPYVNGKPAHSTKPEAMLDMVEATAPAPT